MDAMHAPPHRTNRLGDRLFAFLQRYQILEIGIVAIVYVVALFLATSS
jgi:hypothetical protein